MLFEVIPVFGSKSKYDSNLIFIDFKSTKMYLISKMECFIVKIHFICEIEYVIAKNLRIMGDFKTINVHIFDRP